MIGRTHVLVTGFAPFPGAPVNPTQPLMDALTEIAPRALDAVALRTAVLPVDWEGVGATLEAACDGIAPHIAIHFGLAREARGFRLERIARSASDATLIDNRGNRPPQSDLTEAEHAPSGLPLDAIHTALTAAGLPVEWSDDAGGYLCNRVFYLSASGRCAPLRRALSGFVHVPATDTPGFGEAMLLEGAVMILRACIARQAG